MDSFDIEYIDSLPENEKREINNYMLLRWMACSDDRDKLLRLAALPNKTIFALSQYPALGTHLIASCGTGSKDSLRWRKKVYDKPTRPETVKLLMEYYNMSRTDAEKDAKLMNLDSMIEIAEDLGKDHILNKLRKEFNV